MSAFSRLSTLARRFPPCRPAATPWVAIAIAISAACVADRSHAAPAVPAAADAPAWAVSLPGVRHETFRDLHVDVVGTGRPVIMIPGLDSAADTWTATCAALQPQVACHVVQLPGYAGAPAITSSHWLDTMRDELLAYVADRHLDHPVLMGHSLGGALVLEMAAQAPTMPSRLVVVDSLPCLALLRAPNATPEQLRAMAAGMKAQMLAATPEASAAQAAGTARGMTHGPKDVERLVGWMNASDPATTAESMSDLWGTDLRPLLPRITVPTLVLGSWAAYAPMGATMESTRQIFAGQYAGLAGVDIRMSAAGYHFLMWDDPQWLVSQVRGFIGNT